MPEYSIAVTLSNKKIVATVNEQTARAVQVIVVGRGISRLGDAESLHVTETQSRLTETNPGRSRAPRATRQS